MTDEEFRYPTPELRAAQREELAAALTRNDVPRLRALLAEAEELLQVAHRRRMGAAVSLDVREMIRTAERHLGLAILKGQAEGWVETTLDAQRRSLLQFRGLADNNGKLRTQDVYPTIKHVRFLAEGTDEQFAAALAAAREKRNSLSRTDVSRELKLIITPPGDRPELLRGKRRLNVNHVLAQVIDASGVAPSVAEELDWSQLDEARGDEFVNGLREAANSLTRLQQRVQRRLARRQRERQDTRQPSERKGDEHDG